MSANRLLLLHDDPFLTRFYRAKLEEAGFAVDTAADVAGGLEALGATNPDLIVVDPLLRTPEMPDPVGTLRSHESGSSVPILALPTAHYTLAQNVRASGQARLLTSETNTLSEMLKAAAETLGGSRFNNANIVLAALPDDDWKQQAFAAAQASLWHMRQDLHRLARNAGDTIAMRDLLLRVHHLSGQSRLVNKPVLTHLARAVEMLAFMLNENPQRIDLLSLRTLGQAVDFIGTLLDQRQVFQVPDISDARVVIVEDEGSALELISTAMELVGLNAAGASCPTEGIHQLADVPCDLIFLDINLPEMNGFELCNRIRALPLHDRTPIVFLTGMANFNNRVQSSLCGGNDFAAKPFNVAELGVKAIIWILKGRLGLT